MLRCAVVGEKEKNAALFTDSVSRSVQTVAPWERRGFPLPEDPTPEPEAEDDDGGGARPRMRSISGCRPAPYGRIDSDDAEPPCDDDGGSSKHKTPAHR